MIEEFKSSGAADFRQRYKDTYGWYLTDSGRKVLVQLVDVGENQLKFQGKDGESFTALADKGNRFEFIPLERALYNTPSTVVYCTRVPARQWRRGIHSANTRIVNLQSGIMGSGVPIDFKILSEILHPEDVSTYVSDYLAKRRDAVALNPMFAFTKETVYLYQRRIGTIMGDTIALTENLFKQEISDLCRDLQLTYKVVIK